MKFRTEVDITDSPLKIGMEDKIFTMGSCFATEMAQLFSDGQLQTLNNPFGTIFNPFSIRVALQRLHDAYVYREEDLISYNDEFISLEHHSSFNSNYLHKSLEKINLSTQEGNQFLQESNWIIITYGTAFVYEFLPKNVGVANCHKIPQKFFNKRLLTHNELVENIEETILSLKDICPDEVQILFSVSPVRHTKDGMVENTRSKALLISALHDAIADLDYCHYLPIYEILMDDLRDYRFYKDDMIHPNSQAVNYVFEKFSKSYFAEETKAFVSENFKINQGLNHRTQDPSNPKFIAFQEQIQEKIKLQQAKVKHSIFKHGNQL